MRPGVGKFVFSSTCATFGVPAKLPIAETLPQAPINPYGQTKLDVENALRALAHAGKISFAAFRYFNAAGAAEDGSIGEDHDPETHLIPLAIDAAIGKRPSLQLFGTDYPTPDGTCLRDYVHVDDLSRAHIAVFDKLATPGAAHFYNLGTGTPSSNREVIRAVEKATGKKINGDRGPAAARATRRRSMRIRRRPSGSSAGRSSSRTSTPSSPPPGTGTAATRAVTAAARVRFFSAAQPW